MPLEFFYSDPLGTEEPAVTVSLGSNTVRFGELAISEAAEAGDTASSGVEVDDPNGVWNFVGMRAFTIRETSAPSNNQIVFQGVTQARKVSRDDSMLTGSARRWSIDLTDYNWHLGKRVLVDADSKRPAETAGDRIRWLLTSAAHIALYDYGNVSYPTKHMDAVDYRGQRAIDVLADCALESGYNFWCAYNEAHQRPELFFMSPAALSYQSTVSLTNVLADYDGSTAFLINEGAELTRSPGRIAYGVYMSFAKGAVYVRNDTTGAQFAKYDQTSSLTNVKTAARARRLATKFLNIHNEEDDRITCSVNLPAAQVNDIRVGQLIWTRVSHFPGYESGAWCRVLRRTVHQPELGGGYEGYDNSESVYRLDLELSVAIGGSCASPGSPTGSLGYNKPAAWYGNPSYFSVGQTGDINVIVDGDADGTSGDSCYWDAGVGGGAYVRGFLVDLQGTYDVNTLTFIGSDQYHNGSEAGIQAWIADGTGMLKVLAGDDPATLSALPGSWTHPDDGGWATGGTDGGTALQLTFTPTAFEAVRYVAVAEIWNTADWGTGVGRFDCFEILIGGCPA